MAITETAGGVPNYGVSPREVPDQRARESALLAADVGLPGDIIADSGDVGDRVAASWAEYDRLLELFDRGDIPFEPEGPHAQREAEPEEAEHRSDVITTRGPSERTERRHRGERKGEIQALLARDRRRTVDSARRTVLTRKTADWRLWLKVCDQCGQPFEAKRADARFCSDRCRKRSARG